MQESGIYKIMTTTRPRISLVKYCLRQLCQPKSASVKRSFSIDKNFTVDKHNVFVPFNSSYEENKKVGKNLKRNVKAEWVFCWFC